MATAYPVYSPASAPGLAQFLDADTCKVGILQTVGDAYVGGKLGVGTLTPATLGHFASGATGGTILTLEQAYGDADAPDLTIKKARGTLAAPTVITTADDLGMISFAGYSGAGGYVVGAAIKGTSEGTIATTRVPGRLTFWTGTDAAPTVLTERMRITSDGKVGIGTSVITGGAPWYHLEVAKDGTSAVIGVTAYSSGSASDRPGWSFVRGRGTHAAPAVVQANDMLGVLAFSGTHGPTYGQWNGGAYICAYAETTWSDSTTPGYLTLNTLPASDMVNTPLERVRITSEGKVGIGVTGPTAVLHLKAGTTAASTAPLKLTSGDLMTAPEAGAIEFLSDTFYGTITTGTARKAFAFAADVVPTSRTITAGTGLSGGGDLTANRTLSLDQAVIPTWTGAHTFTGGVTFKNHSAFAGSGFIPETRAIQTTTVTPAVLWSKTLADDTLYWVEVRVIGRDISGAERAYYGRTFYVYRQSAGSATLGNVIELFSEETDADWDVGVNVNTNDVEVKVMGKGSVTINWAGTVTMQAVSGNA